jgi:hypothetical protein
MRQLRIRLNDGAEAGTQSLARARTESDPAQNTSFPSMTPNMRMTRKIVSARKKRTFAIDRDPAAM